MGSRIEQHSNVNSEVKEAADINHVTADPPSSFADTENLALAVSLLAAHKRILETVQSMKTEMELVQAMEDSEDRDVKAIRLKNMLDRREGALNTLREGCAYLESLANNLDHTKHNNGSEYVNGLSINLLRSLHLFTLQSTCAP